VFFVFGLLPILLIVGGALLIVRWLWRRLRGPRAR